MDQKTIAAFVSDWNTREIAEHLGVLGKELEARSLPWVGSSVRASGIVLSRHLDRLKGEPS